MRFGCEEEEEIGPAVAATRAEGFDASGSSPPDTPLHRASRGEVDFVVAMYHDQGPFVRGGINAPPLLNFDNTTNHFTVV
jgi:4-hydroxy-L-threonine phosphate dehydrogenase PdxA